MVSWSIKIEAPQDQVLWERTLSWGDAPTQHCGQIITDPSG
jgi:hypothetical protein